MIPERVKAMITLLDDSDDEVVSIVSSKLKDLGKEIIPVLESEWKNNVLNPVLQQNIGDLVHELKFISLKSDLIAWKSDESFNLLKGLWLVATYQFPELKIETLQPCGFALREGVIIDYLREIEAESLPPVPDVEDKRLRGVFAIGRRFGYEEKHALQVSNLAEKIFDRKKSQKT